MMQSSFKRIAQLKVFHSYFENNECTCLRFVPSDTTNTIMNEFGVKIRASSSGFDIYFDLNNAIETVFNDISKLYPAYFEFIIVNKDPAFYMYTELPAGTLLYDTGFNTTVMGDGALILKEQIDNAPTTLSLGRILLRFDDILNPITESGFARFCISYMARATQWQYYVISKGSISLNNLAIVGDNNIRFDGPKKVTNAAGETVLLFTSGDNLLPLSEVPRFYFSMVTGPEGAPTKTILKSLPNPGIAQIVQNETNTFSSPIYIYL